MPLGDYVKTTYVEGSAPGISATRLNNNENKTAELDQQLEGHITAPDPHSQYALDTDLSGLAGAGRTTETVKQNADNLNVHLADFVRNPAYAQTTGTANTYAITTNPAPTAYVDGMSAYLDINVANTGASTLNWNALGAKTIVDGKGNALIAGKLPLNGIVGVRYNASTGNFQLLGEGGDYGTAGAAQTLTGYTLGTANGIIPGTMPTKVGSATVITPSAVDQAVPQGYTDGALTSVKVSGDANLVAGNILSGKSIFGVAGTVAQQLTATGTTGNSVSSLNFTELAPTSQSLASAYVTVSGLTFQANYILLKESGGSFTIYEVDAFYGTCKIIRFGGGFTSQTAFSLDGTNAYVNATGFRLPVALNNTAYTYKARN